MHSLLKPIYGLHESCDEWNQNLDEHVQINLKMTSSIIHTSLYCKFEDDRVVQINGNYTDNLLRQGTGEWQTHSDAILEQLKAAENQQAPFTFAEMHITEFDNMYHINQDLYTSKIEKIPSNAEFSTFASM